MFERIIFIILVLTATGLFRFIAPQVGIDVKTVSIALLIVQGSYLLVNKRYVSFLLRDLHIKLWVIFLLVWPMISITYAPKFDLREIGIQVYYFSLFFVTVVFGLKKGLPTLHRVLVVSFVVSLFGLVLSMLSPEYFETVAEMTAARSEYQGRAYGFFLQPNSAGSAIVFMFMAVYSLWKGKISSRNIAFILLFIGSILITASRSNAAFAVLIIFLIFYHSFRSNRIAKSTSMTKMFVRITAALIIIMVSFSIINEFASKNITPGKRDIYARLAMMSSFRLSESGVGKDDSVTDRLHAQATYLFLALERPLTGYGIGSDAYFKSRDIIAVSAHSSMVKSILEYGALYPLLFFILMFHLYYSPYRKLAEIHFRSNSLFQFFALSSIMFATQDTILASGGRGYLVILGFFVLSGRFLKWSGISFENQEKEKA